MKKVVIALSVVIAMASCKNASDTKTNDAQKDTVVVQQPAVVKEVHYVNSSSSPAQSQPAATQKKGWSKAAKGTAIGAGSGAVVGALVSKKKGKGAVIGGVVGAGAGYLIGRDQDKRDGRVKH